MATSETTPPLSASEGPMIPPNQPPSAPMPTSFEEMLKYSGFEHVLIIDDVLDMPTVTELSRRDVDKFAQDLAEQPSYHEEAKRLGVDAASGLLSDENLRALWSYCLSKHKSTEQVDVGTHTFDTPLAMFTANHPVFLDRIERYFVVDFLCQAFKARSVKVTALGAVDSIPDENAKVNLVFLDFVLEPNAAARGRSLDQSAIDKLQEVYRKYSVPPYVILISDRQEIHSQQRAKICQAVGTLGGFYGFIKKDELRDETMLFLKLAELGVGTGYHGHQEIRAFANTMADEMNAVAQSLREFIYRLELQDYVHLQAKRLAAEHQPLGEYIQWLFEAKLGHLFTTDSAVAEKRAAVDVLTYKNLLPAPTELSDALSEAFFCAQTQPSTSQGVRLPQLGDVYVSGKKVCVVINNACDLFASADGTSRQPSPEMPVYIVEGSADEKHPHFDRVTPNVTDCFLIDGKLHRITWNVTSGVRTIDFGTFADSLAVAGFKFTAQFRPLFAVAIQRQFADHLCRVGLPIAPPIGLPAHVNVYGGDQSDRLVLLANPILLAAHIRHEGAKPLARLTVDGVSQIRIALKNAMADLDPIGISPEAKAWVKGHLAEIRAVLKKDKLWLRLVNEFTPSSPW